MLNKMLTNTEMQQIIEHVMHYYDGGTPESALKLVQKTEAQTQGV